MEKKITGFNLKMIAVITMFIDHLAAVVLARMIDARSIPFILNHEKAALSTYLVMRLIGRISFPLFIFLLVEGFRKTRSVPKYLLRIGIFAILSEIPYDLAIHYSAYNAAGEGFWDRFKVYFFNNNVMITLFIGLLCIWAMDSLAGFFGERERTPKSGIFWMLLHMLAMFAVIGAGIVAGYFSGCDYGPVGVVAICAAYVLMDYPKIAIAAAIVLLSMNDITELFALFVLIPIHLYNGERGRDIKYFFYAFYPVHLLALAGIAWLLSFAGVPFVLSGSY